MAGKATVNQDALNKKVQDFHDAHDTIDASLKALQADADSLTVPAVWSGAAADQFKQLMDTYSQQAQQLNNKLRDTADHLATVGSKFQNHDEQNASNVKQIMGSLDLPPVG